MIGSVAAIVLPLIAVANAAPAPQDPPPAPVDTAFVTNNCDFPLAFTRTADNTPTLTQTLDPNGGMYSQPIAGSGVSMQVRQMQGGDDNELDYTLATGDMLYYSLGGTNGYAFEQYGLTVVPSLTTCASIICPAGGGCALGVTQECTGSTNLTLTVCSG